ncbi:GNAT family N-acetyltransferase [Staphylococcus pseudintermedius]|uniref:GNAT family N-acetyltransferase n=1 Tax=Staphylococcus pseudintermedius TaxID=283734 RepID=UPI00374FB13B
MSIIPQYRGQSIGTHLLHKFIEEMRKTSYKGISLSVSYGILFTYYDYNTY